MSKISKRDIEVSCGIVIVRYENNTPLFLLLRTYSHWEMPKGRQEKNEKPLETAIREVYEETGISEDDLNFKWGTVSKDTGLYKKGKKYATYFIAETNKSKVIMPINPEIGKPENDEYLWAAYDKAMKLTNERVQKILRWANELIQDK